MIIKIVFIVLSAIWIVGGILLIKYMASSPEAYQDDKGFHVGKEPPQDLT